MCHPFLRVRAVWSGTGCGADGFTGIVDNLALVVENVWVDVGSLPAISRPDRGVRPGYASTEASASPAASEAAGGSMGGRSARLVRPNCWRKAGVVA